MNDLSLNQPCGAVLSPSWRPPLVRGPSTIGTHALNDPRRTPNPLDWSSVRRDRRHRVLRQGDHRQARLPPRRRCGHADHVPHAVRAAAVRALSWWAGRGQPPLTRADWRMVVGLGFCGYYLASFLDFAGLQYINASLERLILYLNPTLVLALGVLLFNTQGQARPAGRARRQLPRRAAGVRPRAHAQRRARRARRGAGVRQRGQLRGLPGLQRRGGEAPRRAAPDRPGDQRGLRAVHRAVLPAAAAVRRWRWRPR